MSMGSSSEAIIKQRTHSDRLNLDNDPPAKQVKRGIEPIDLDLTRRVKHALHFPMIKAETPGEFALAHGARREGGNEGDLRRGAGRNRHHRLAALRRRRARNRIALPNPQPQRLLESALRARQGIGAAATAAARLRQVAEAVCHSVEEELEPSWIGVAYGRSPQ